MSNVVRCAFCRRRAWRLGICKRHKNKKINWRFYMAPVVLYCATNDPEDWTTTENAGAIEVLK